MTKFTIHKQVHKHPVKFNSILSIYPTEILEQINNTYRKTFSIVFNNKKFLKLFICIKRKLVTL